MDVTLDQCIRLKENGNESLKKGDLGEAALLYSRALNLLSDLIDSGKRLTCPDIESASKLRAILFSNRSLAYLKLKRLAASISDASKACVVKPDYAKGHYRKAEALKSVNLDQEAIA
eukprot:2142772-Rhodomonas_salina.1